jgi:hypothetical protein
VDIGKQYVYNCFSDIYMNMPQHNTVSYETYYNNRCSHCNNHLRRKNGVKERQKTDTFSKMLHITFKIIDKGK